MTQTPRLTRRRLITAALAAPFASLPALCTRSRHSVARTPRSQEMGEDRPDSAAARSNPGIVDRVVLYDRHSDKGHSNKARHVTGGDAIQFEWRFGDRAALLEGVSLHRSALNFDLRTNGRRRLTLELREFRTVPDSGVAYVVEVNGEKIAFRNRKYDGVGPTSAFIDIPDRFDGKRRLRVTLRNLAPAPIAFSEAVVYEDLEAFVRAEGLLQPLYVGPTAPLDRDQLTKIRALLPETAELRPMFVLPTFAVAQWPADEMADRLDETLELARDLKMPVELQLNTWWAGTPSGCDGAGGRWYDPEYQQVTYSPAAGKYGLSVPNHWSSVPWLTTRNHPLNAFKARCMRTFGQMLRQRSDASADPLPILSLVLDNEVTYWGAGNPDTPPDLEADFNPSVVAAARSEGVRLDPRNGMSKNEMGFLRRSLRAYNRSTLGGLREGLGEGPLAERVYTHTFMRGWVFENPIQATEVGTLQNARMGGEWDGMSAASLGLLDQHRELGIPSGINDERSGGAGAVPDVQFAYATGCDHLSLFNISDDGLAEIGRSISDGWQSFPPVPWRPALLNEDFRDGAAWKRLFQTTSEVAVDVIWPGPMRALFGKKLNEANRCRMQLSSAKLTGKPTLDRLSLAYRARAFVNGEKSDRAYLSVRAGVKPDQLQEIDRITNFNGLRQVNLSNLAAGQPDLWIEFTFHPIGLPGWVCIFDLRLESPWAEETLLATNRSYRADRLRCESSLVGWRADAFWMLDRVEKGPAAARTAEVAKITAARNLFAAGDYRPAYDTCCAILRSHAPRPAAWKPPAPDRVEQGELRSASFSDVPPESGEIRIDPYSDGCMGLRLTVAPGALLELEENGKRSAIPSPTALLPGDDVEATLRNSRIVHLIARRGSAMAAVTAMTPTTPFALPTLTVEGQPARKISSVAAVRGRRQGPARSCWLRVGPTPFEIGDDVQIRWNPRTNRIVEIVLRSPGHAKF